MELATHAEAHYWDAGEEDDKLKVPGRHWRNLSCIPTLVQAVGSCGGQKCPRRGGGIGRSRESFIYKQGSFIHKQRYFIQKLSS